MVLLGKFEIIVLKNSLRLLFAGRLFRMGILGVLTESVGGFVN